MESQHNAPARFTFCNNEKCSSRFNYFDFGTVHTVVDGPDPRDHFANERNLLTWVRVGMVLALIGFMSLLDFTRVFAPSNSLPWAEEKNLTKTHTVAYIFVALGITTICVAIPIYFKNMNSIVKRLFTVGHGWAGYSMFLLLILFVLFVMVAALA